VIVSLSIINNGRSAGKILNTYWYMDKLQRLELRLVHSSEWKKETPCEGDDIVSSYMETYRSSQENWYRLTTYIEGIRKS